MCVCERGGGGGGSCLVYRLDCKWPNKAAVSQAQSNQPSTTKFLEGLGSFITIGPGYHPKQEPTQSKKPEEDII